VKSATTLTILIVFAVAPMLAGATEPLTALEGLGTNMAATGDQELLGVPVYGKPTASLNPNKKHPGLLPWDDTYVSQQGLVTLGLVSSKRGCSLRVKRPYDGVSLKRENQYDESRFGSYDLHEQIAGTQNRRFRVDFLNLLKGGCGRLGDLF